MKASRWTIRWLVVLMAVATAWMLAGCDDGGDDSDDAGGAAATDGGSTGGTSDDGGSTGGATNAAPASVDVAGVWNGTRSSDGGAAQLQFFFEQTGDVLSGDYHDTSGYEGHMAGTIDGDDIQLVLVLTAGAPGATWTFTGAVNASGNHIVGHMDVGGGSDDIDATR